VVSLTLNTGRFWRQHFCAIVLDPFHNALRRQSVTVQLTRRGSPPARPYSPYSSALAVCAGILVCVESVVFSYCRLYMILLKYFNMEGKYCYTRGSAKLHGGYRVEFYMFSILTSMFLRIWEFRDILASYHKNWVTFSSTFIVAIDATMLVPASSLLTTTSQLSLLFEIGWRGVCSTTENVHLHCKSISISCLVLLDLLLLAFTFTASLLSQRSRSPYTFWNF
jgi:hypothetical protein